MMKKAISVNGKEYPLLFKMGSIRLFKEQFNKEFEDIKSVGDMTEFLYCCVLCAARIEGQKININIDQFSDELNLGEVANLFTALVEDSGVDVSTSGQNKRKQA